MPLKTPAVALMTLAPPVLQQQMTSRPSMLCLLAGQGATSSWACLERMTRKKAEVLL
jgi:hypothetical protein